MKIFVVLLVFVATALCSTSCSPALEPFRQKSFELYKPTKGNWWDTTENTKGINFAGSHDYIDLDQGVSRPITGIKWFPTYGHLRGCEVEVRGSNTKSALNMKSDLIIKSCKMEGKRPNLAGAEQELSNYRWDSKNRNKAYRYIRIHWIKTTVAHGPLTGYFKTCYEQKDTAVCKSFAPGTDQNGGWTLFETLSSSNADDCKRKCMSNSNCKAYVHYVTTCYLSKTKATAKTHRGGRTYGECKRGTTGGGKGGKLQDLRNAPVKSSKNRNPDSQNWLASNANLPGNPTKEQCEWSSAIKTQVALSGLDGRTKLWWATKMDPAKRVTSVEILGTSNLDSYHGGRNVVVKVCKHEQSHCVTCGQIADVNQFPAKNSVKCPPSAVGQWVRIERPAFGANWHFCRVHVYAELPFHASEYFKGQQEKGADEKGAGYYKNKQISITLPENPKECQKCVGDKCVRHCMEAVKHKLAATKAKSDLGKYGGQVTKLQQALQVAQNNKKEAQKHYDYHSRKFKEWQNAQKEQHELDVATEKLAKANKRLKEAKAALNSASTAKDKAEKAHKVLTAEVAVLKNLLLTLKDRSAAIKSKLKKGKAKLAGVIIQKKKQEGLNQVLETEAKQVELKINAAENKQRAKQAELKTKYNTVTNTRKRYLAAKEEHAAASKASKIDVKSYQTKAASSLKAAAGA